MIKKIDVSSYNPKWPEMFDVEAKSIKQALGENCVAVHHVGSTAVPGLAAKPKVDIIAVVKNPSTINSALEKIGYEKRGEYNIPFHYGFAKREKDVSANLHVYEEGNPEIELNLLFRDYLRQHPEALAEYAQLKLNLIDEPSSHEKKAGPFNGYNLGKDEFIRKILKAANYNRNRMVKCTHYAEWEFAKKIRQKYFFDGLSISDPYTWTFDHEEHAHMILYKGVEMIGYAHIQLWPSHRAALRIIVIDEPYRQDGLGSEFLKLCEKWLKNQGIVSLHDEARPDAVKFYRKNGYVEMPFNDPSGEPPSPHDLAMGKML